MYPDDDVVIAVLINREEIDDNDHATKIATAIGKLIF